MDRRVYRRRKIHRFTPASTHGRNTVAELARFAVQEGLIDKRELLGDRRENFRQGRSTRRVGHGRQSERRPQWL